MILTPPVTLSHYVDAAIAVLNIFKTSSMVLHYLTTSSSSDRCLWLLPAFHLSQRRDFFLLVGRKWCSASLGCSKPARLLNDHTILGR